MYSAIYRLEEGIKKKRAISEGKEMVSLQHDTSEIDYLRSFLLAACCL